MIIYMTMEEWIEFCEAYLERLMKDNSEILKRMKDN